MKTLKDFAEDMNDSTTGTCKTVGAEPIVDKDENNNVIALIDHAALAFEFECLRQETAEQFA